MIKAQPGSSPSPSCGLSFPFSHYTSYIMQPHTFRWSGEDNTSCFKIAVRSFVTMEIRTLPGQNFRAESTQRGWRLAAFSTYMPCFLFTAELSACFCCQWTNNGVGRLPAINVFMISPCTTRSSDGKAHVCSAITVLTNGKFKSQGGETLLLSGFVDKVHAWRRRSLMARNEAANFFPNVRSVSVKENEISDNESYFNGRQLRRTKPWNSLQLFFFTFSLYCCTLDIMWNIKSFNYLNYAYIWKEAPWNQRKLRVFLWQNSLLKCT